MPLRVSPKWCAAAICWTQHLGKSICKNCSMSPPRNTPIFRWRWTDPAINSVSRPAPRRSISKIRRRHCGLPWISWGNPPHPLCDGNRRRRSSLGRAHAGGWLAYRQLRPATGKPHQRQHQPDRMDRVSAPNHRQVQDLGLENSESESDADANATAASFKLIPHNTTTTLGESR